MEENASPTVAPGVVSVAERLGAFAFEERPSSGPECGRDGCAFHIG